MYYPCYMFPIMGCLTQYIESIMSCTGWYESSDHDRHIPSSGLDRVYSRSPCNWYFQGRRSINYLGTESLLKQDWVIFVSHSFLCLSFLFSITLNEQHLWENESANDRDTNISTTNTSFLLYHLFAFHELNTLP